MFLVSDGTTGDNEYVDVVYIAHPGGMEMINLMEHQGRTQLFNVFEVDCWLSVCRIFKVI